MTTETLEASTEQGTAKGQEDLAGSLDADKAMVLDMERVKVLASREKGFTTRIRLDVGAIAEHRMFANCEAFANSPEEAPNIRRQTAKLLAMTFGKSSGTATDDNEIYRMIKAYAMASGLVAGKAVAQIPKLPWSSLRVLVRWIDWDQAENTFACRFTVDVGVKDDDGRTTRDVDASDMLAELISALIAAPLDKAKLAKVMDAKESQAREGQLVYLTNEQRKQASAAKSMADRVKDNEERAAMFDAFARKMVNAKQSAEQVFNELFNRGLIPASKTKNDGGIDASTIAQLTAIDAATIGKVLNHAKNMTAMVALYNELKPIIEAGSVSQPNKSAGASLNETGTPNHDPIGNVRNMHLAKTG